MKAIKIVGIKERFLSTELIELVSLFKNVNPLYWSILYLEAFGEIEGQVMLDFEKQINNSINGVDITVEELQNLSRSVEIIDLILIASQDKRRNKRYTEDEEMYLNCDFTIELVDSSYWMVHARKDSDLVFFEEVLGASYVEKDKD